MLLNQWLRHWVPADHLVHFIIDVVAGLDLRAARVNKRGGVDAEATSSNAKSSLSLSHSKILMENPCRRHPSKMAQPFWLLAARGQSPTRC
jgi:hypothetical protein